MKIEDLRIGNIVGINGSVITDEICVSEILTMANVGNYFCDLKYNRPSKFLIGGYTGCFVNDLIPILLTEKILLQCGFYKENNYTSNDNVFVKEIRFPSFFTIVEEEKGYKLCDADIYTNIIYLHELQNLYFALTKKELPIDINTLEL